MASRSHDGAFAEFVVAERPRLLGVAFLMFGTAQRAEDVVQSSLAYLYGAWPGHSDAPALALFRILHTTPGRLVLPWQRGERIELIDGSADRPLLPPGVVSDLAELSADARRVLILERYIQLPSVQIATLAGVDVARVHVLSGEARAALVARDTSRADDAVLAEQLRDALPFPEPQDEAAASDLRHGRLLVRRRLLRVVASATALLLAVVLGAWQLVPLIRPDREVTGPPPTVSAPPTCDARQSTCRTTRVREWRNAMAQVTGSYVDPARTYFSGYTFSYDERYDSLDFWSGQGGALGLDMYRLSAGSTEVYVQIATSREFAVPCGQITRHTCDVTRFMDGNVFTLSDASLSQGLEVQYTPTGGQVITVVARNTTRGTSLDISLDTLIALVQDERLQLPQL